MYLLDRIGLLKTPSLGQIRLPNALARLTTSSLRHLSSITRAAISSRTSLDSFLNFVFEVSVDVFLRDSNAVCVESGFGHVMVDVLVDFAGNVRYVEGENYGIGERMGSK